MALVDPVFFGAGTLTLTPAGANPTPIQVGILQDVDLDVSMAEKELHGADQYPVAVATGKGKITGKAKSGSINGGLINSIMSGGVVTSGRLIGVEEQIVQANASATVAHAADFEEDLGVLDLTDGIALVRVASGPGAGEYSVSAGVYTLDSGANGNTLSIRYAYADTSGSTIALSNQPMGSSPTFVVSLYNQTTQPDGTVESNGIKLWACKFSKLTFPFKNEDFAMNDLSFSAFADGQRRVITTYTPNVLPVTA